MLLVGSTSTAVAQPAARVTESLTPAATVFAAAKTKKPALRLTTSRTYVVPGSRVKLRVTNATKVKRIVRVQRWDSRKRVWRTVSKRKVRTATTVVVKAPTGTTRYRAVASKVRANAGNGSRVHRAVRSSVVSVRAPQAKVRARKAGSAPVGQASYPVPSSALYVTARGLAIGSGTKDDPFGSLEYAVSKAPAGATLVLRAGRYHESLLIPSNKTGIVIQNHPGEAAWLDGSEPVTNWKASGTQWVANGWNHLFDHRIMSGAVDETSRWVDSSRPLASHPDQVWINGAALTQVASEQAVVPGTFYVDKYGRRLVIGDDPAGKTVEASSLQRALEIHAKNAVLRGIGIRRYATTDDQYAAVIAGVSGISFENVVVADNAWIGIAGWASGQRYRRVTVTGNGIMGFGGNQTSDLVIENSVFRGNNAQGFKPTPIASGMKITRASKVLLRNNVVADTPYAGGVWFDVSSSRLTIVGNAIFGNAAGLMIELSENAVVADNQIYGNDGTGVRIQASGSVDVWNNTIVGNPRPFAAWEDGRRQDVASLAATIPWKVADIDVHNNVMSMTGAFGCPILTQDETQVLYGNDFGITSNHNTFHRPGAATPANFACWANGIYQVKSFKNLTQFRAGTGNDKSSTLTHGASPVDGRGVLTSATRRSVSSTATALPASIAAAIGQAPGTLMLGAFTAR